MVFLGFFSVFFCFNEFGMGPNGFHEVDTVLPLRSVIEANPKVFLF